MTAVLSALVAAAILVAAYLVSRLLLPSRRPYRYVGHRQLPGWKGSEPFYEFKCRKHGLVESYPAGYGQVLRCPLCEEENKP